MTDRELTGKVHSAVYHQCQRRGYAAPVDVLMEIGVLPKEKYEDWRRGRIDYLHRQPPQALFHHARDTGIRAEKRPQALRDRI